EAIDPLRAALAAWPPGADSGEVRYHLALAYERAGELAMAEANARAAVASAAKHSPEPSWLRDARQMAARLAPKSELPAVPKTARSDRPTASTGEASAPTAVDAPNAPEAAGPPPPPPAASEPAPKTP